MTTVVLGFLVTKSSPTVHSSLIHLRLALLFNVEQLFRLSTELVALQVNLHKQSSQLLGNWRWVMLYFKCIYDFAPVCCLLLALELHLYKCCVVSKYRRKERRS